MFSLAPVHDNAPTYPSRSFSRRLLALSIAKAMSLSLKPPTSLTVTLSSPAPRLVPVLLVSL